MAVTAVASQTVKIEKTVVMKDFLEKMSVTVVASQTVKMEKTAVTEKMAVMARILIRPDRTQR